MLKLTPHPGYSSFIAVFLLVLALMPAAGANIKPAPSACLQGTFIQLLDSQAAWKESDWKQLFDYFKMLQLSQMVVQWSMYDNTAFYPSANFKSSANSPLEWILQMADEAGMHVMIGLAHDTQYWEKISHGQKEKEAYLSTALARSATVAREVEPLARKFRSFQGWYITEEVDDLNWVKPESSDALFFHLQQLSTFLHVLTPGAQIGISGFANRSTAPEAVEQFWTALLKKSKFISILYFQDGIGAKKLQLENLADYLAAVQKAATLQHRDFQPVIELFQQTSGYPVNAGQFEATPATLDRIFKQTNIANMHAPNHIAFGVPEYATPMGGTAAEKLFNDYVAFMIQKQTKCDQSD